MKIKPDTNRGAVFILPSQPGPATGPASPWIPAAGWAQAAVRRWGHVMLVTPRGILTPEQVLEIATSGESAPTRRSATHGMLPPILSTVKKDARNVIRAFSNRRLADVTPWQDIDLAFIWQRHEVFQRPGLILAKRLNRPLVLFVDSPVVWEAEKWGIRRPGWGKWIERFGERPQLLSADLVCCVSQEVADQVRSMGAHKEKILVTPNAVDTATFRPDRSINGSLPGLDLHDRFVIGWIGSFRRFHGVDLILQALAKLESTIPGCFLLLVGDGLERDRLERMAAELGLHNVFFTGLRPYAEIPRYLSAMHVAVISDPDTSAFHYSPLKLREYMACGKAIVAARSGQIARVLSHEFNGLLVDPGSSEALASAIIRLHRDAKLRETIGRNARAEVVRNGSWDDQLERVTCKLKDLRGEVEQASHLPC